MHFGDSYDAYSVGLDIAQHLLRDIVAYAVEVVRFKGSAQVGRGRSNATKVGNILAFRRIEPVSTLSWKLATFANLEVFNFRPITPSKESPLVLMLVVVAMKADRPEAWPWQLR